MAGMARGGFSFWFRALTIAMACLLLAAKESIGTTPPMYLVFFEYVSPGTEERGTITKISEPVLKNAIEAFWYTPGNTVCITGHYDRTGRAEDRQPKSRILAESVAAYFVAHGIPSDSIVTTSKGDIENSVPSEDGVEEPANRYVLILLGTDTWKPTCR